MCFSQVFSTLENGCEVVSASPVTCNKGFYECAQGFCPASSFSSPDQGFFFFCTDKIEKVGKYCRNHLFIPKALEYLQFLVRREQMAPVLQEMSPLLEEVVGEQETAV